jgi:hypothetical protein
LKEVGLSVASYERFLAIDGQIFVPGDRNFPPQIVLENWVDIS